MTENFVFDFIPDSKIKEIRIDEFLREKLPGKIKEGELSNSKIRRLIISGAVYVNNRSCTRPAFELRGKSKVSVQFDEQKFFYEKQPDDIKFEVSDSDVLFENDSLIFINKPAFFPVEQTITGNRDNLHDAVVRYLWKRDEKLRNPPYVGIMHRLDRETSGVILFTKKRDANKEISEMFQSHDFIKEYVALCVCKSKNGKVLKAGDSFTVEKFMGRVSGKSQAGKWGLVPESRGGQYSKTDFLVMEKVVVEGIECVAVKCSLYTGRTHQIRVHLSEAGFPLIGDELYGGPKARRIYLHSAKLQCEKWMVESVPDFLK